MNPIDVFTKQAMGVMASEASAEHYRRLEEGALCATRCDDCARMTFPPQSHCPGCFGEHVSWEGARLYAFTTQGRALRFRTPAVIGIVEIPDVGLVLSPIEGAFSELRIGQALRPTTIQIDDGARRVHGFAPDA